MYYKPSFNINASVDNLGLVISLQKRDEIIEILYNPHPIHEKRLWLVGFLQYVGYSESEICELIKDYNMWQDYDPARTGYYVRKILNRRERKSIKHSGEMRPLIRPSEARENGSISVDSSPPQLFSRMVNCKYHDDAEEECRGCHHARIHTQDALCGTCHRVECRCLPVGYTHDCIDAYYAVKCAGCQYCLGGSCANVECPYFYCLGWKRG